MGMDGNCFAFVSDGHAQRDILDKSLIKGWIEVENGQWAERPEAGVTQVGTLQDQIAAAQAPEEEEEVVMEPDCEGDADDKDPFKKKDGSNCPVMPVVRKARDKVVETAKAAGKWVKRLFPQYLGAPDEEDAVPEDDADKD